MPTENTHAKNLKKAIHLSKKIPRAAGGIIGDLVKSKLGSYMEIMDLPFLGIAISVALLKDVLDFTGFGSIPGVSIIVGIVIAASLLVMGSSFKMQRRTRKNTTRYMLKKIGTLIGGTFLESIFGLDFLPVETLMVVYLYKLILSERRERSQNNQKASLKSSPATT